LATAYVLILVMLGPVAARYTEPVARKLTSRGKTAPAPAPAGGPAEERLDDPANTGS
jgi:CPA2 family monovalent cation:H+ antiporter-2